MAGLGAGFPGAQFGAFRFVLDADVGMMHSWGYDWQPSQTPYPSDPDRNGVMIGGRVGFDTGGDTARFHVVLDIADAVTGHFVVHDVEGSARDMGTEVALQAEMMVGC